MSETFTILPNGQEFVITSIHWIGGTSISLSWGWLYDPQPVEWDGVAGQYAVEYVPVLGIHTPQIATFNQATSGVIPNLTPGVVYQFTVGISTNSFTGPVFHSLWATANRTVGPSIPGAPTNFVAKWVGGTQLQFSWTPPTDNGDSPILNYLIQVYNTPFFLREPGGGFTDWVIAYINTPTAASSVVLDVSHVCQPNTLYYFYVAAVNAAGTGGFGPNWSNQTSGYTGRSTIETITQVSTDVTQNLQFTPVVPPTLNGPASTWEQALTDNNDATYLNFDPQFGIWLNLAMPPVPPNAVAIDSLVVNFRSDAGTTGTSPSMIIGVNATGDIPSSPNYFSPLQVNSISFFVTGTGIDGYSIPMSLWGPQTPFAWNGYNLFFIVQGNISNTINVSEMSVTFNYIVALPDIPPAKWVNPTSALILDNQSTVADVSYINVSDFLVVSGFNFNLPAESIPGVIEVNVTRNSVGPVQDLEAYVVLGTTIMSPNLANPNTWPSVETVTEYPVTSSQFQLLVPTFPVQPGGWTVAQVNDPTFGFAIRVQGESPDAGNLVLIDFIEMTILYQDDVGGYVKVGGTAKLVASGWHAKATGGIAFGGAAKTLLTGTERVSGGGVICGGTAAMSYHYKASGGCHIGGMGLPNWLYGSGGIICGGRASVASTETVDLATGGLSFGGTAGLLVDWLGYRTAGGLSLGGGAIVYLHYHDLFAKGGVIFGGTSPVVSSIWHANGQGGLRFAGAAKATSNTFDIDVADIGFSVLVSDVTMIFGSESNVASLSVSTDTIDACGCLSIPVSLQFSSNFAKNNKFTEFLQRNNLSFSNDFVLYYNAVNNLWQRNIQYQGLSTNVNTQEKWTLIFELQCTDFVGGTIIGQQVLLFTMQIVQKNLSTLESYGTRIVVGFLPDSTCASGDFEAEIVYDTVTDVASIQPTATIYYNILYDDLNLFQNQFWLLNPNLNIQISSAALSPPQNYQNMDVVFNR